MATKQLNIRVNQTGAKKAQTEMRGLGKATSSTAANLKNMSGVITGIMASAIVTGINSFSRMGASIQGVEKAFKRISTPGLLKELQKATRNTVNDFELMKAAVRANNFQIPLENLGTLLKFAQLRARETGESVDYLTESIVMGIGRKSVMILDNLGLSAIRVREEFKKTGDMAKAVATIANEEMKKMGDTSGSSNADKMDQFSTAIDNFTQAVAILTATPVASALGAATTNINDLSTAIDELANSKSKAQQIEELQATIQRFENVDGMEKMVEKYRASLAKLKNENMTLSERLGIDDKTNFKIDQFNNGSIKSIEIVKKTTKVVDEAEIAYQKWAAAKQTKIVADEQEQAYMRRLNAEMIEQAGLLKNAIMPALDDYNSMAAKVLTAKPLELIDVDNLSDASGHIDYVVSEIAQKYNTIAQMTDYLIGDTLVAAIERGENAFESFGRAAMRILMDLGIKMATFGLVSSIFPGFGGLVGGLGGFLGFGGGRASGGDVNPGNYYMVGEDGPELFAPSQPGRIIPNQQISNVNNESRNLTINFNGNITDKRFVNDVIIPEIKKHVQLGRA